MIDLSKLEELKNKENYDVQEDLDFLKEIGIDLVCYDENILVEYLEKRKKTLSGNALDKFNKEIDSMLERVRSNEEGVDNREFMNFSQALESLKKGKKIFREIWSFFPDYLFIVNFDVEILDKNISWIGQCRPSNKGIVSISPKLYEPWIPTSDDLFAEDWQVFIDLIRLSP